MIVTDTGRQTHTYLEWAGITAEDYGLLRTVTANPNAVTAADLAPTTAIVSANPDTNTVRRPRGKPFTGADDPRRNVKGRPKKGETFAEKYLARIDKDADALVEAHIKRARGTNAVAARDFELAAAYALGRPLQKFAGVVAETRADALDQRLADLLDASDIT